MAASTYFFDVLSFQGPLRAYTYPAPAERDTVLVAA